MNTINKLVNNVITRKYTNLLTQSTLPFPDISTVSAITDVTTAEATEPIKVIKDQCQIWANG